MSNKKYHHGDLKNALIKAGAEILSQEGIGGLSLRKVASRAGVSHAAPYAHFADKQALIAAISTEGYKQLYAKLDAVISPNAGNPRKQLVESAWAYANFALEHPDTFKVMFSGILEKEKDYPAFVEASQQTFRRVVGIAQACQQAGILRPAPADVLAVAVWGQLHGIVLLVLEGQVSHTITERVPLQEMILFALNQVALVDLTAE